MKKIAILGSTGSVGRQALDVVRIHSDKFKVVGLACKHDSGTLKEQIKEFKPEVVSVTEEDGQNAILKVATWPSAEIVVVAVVGITGLLPTIKAIQAGKDIALATKEVVVVAGNLINQELKKHKVKLVPIDSEQSAIFQCLRGEKKREIKRIYLTCSGGPFRGKKRKDLKKTSPKEALSHPTWRMGPRTTIDSATLMNKGLEVIETQKLFNLKFEQIEIIIHPESIVHSMVEFVDGNILALLGPRDMRLAIQYALSFPERLTNNFPRVNFVKLSKLTFEKPDTRTFPCLGLAFKAAKLGGTMPAVLAAANGVAVDAFLKERIKFSVIPEIIKKVMTKHRLIKDSSLKKIIETDEWARRKAKEEIQR